MTLPVPSDPKWLMDSAPPVDITPKLNVLNKKFQGHGQLVSVAGDNEHRSIRYKTCLMESPAFSDNLLPFPNMQGTYGLGYTVQS